MHCHWIIRQLHSVLIVTILWFLKLILTLRSALRGWARKMFEEKDLLTLKRTSGHWMQFLWQGQLFNSICSIAFTLDLMPLIFSIWSGQLLLRTDLMRFELLCIPCTDFHYGMCSLSIFCVRNSLFGTFLIQYTMRLGHEGWALSTSFLPLFLVSFFFSLLCYVYLN